ncbi:hypothetical protein M422DRAFT_157875, partial [Sphaerobolus stellatus SS14]
AQCNTGAVQCCNSIEKADSPSATRLLGLVGATVADPNVLVGLGCTDVNVLAANGLNCAQQPACCEENQFNGLVNVGCTPASL